MHSESTVTDCIPDETGLRCKYCGWSPLRGKWTRHQCGTCVPGVGKELKRLLKRVGITPTGQCNCEQRAALMDQEGPDWCEQNLDTIVRWLQEESEKRALPLRLVSKLPFLIPGIVKRAIRNTRKKLKALQR